MRIAKINSKNHRKENFPFFIFIFSFFIFSFTNAQTLKEYVKIAEKNNSLVKISTADFDLAQEKVNEISYKNTSFSLDIFALTPETRVGSQLFKVGFSQQLPWIGELEAKKNVINALADVKQLDIALSKKDIQYKVSTAYYTIYEQKAINEILKDNKLILKTYEKMALSALSNNKATMSDVLRIRVQKNELHSKMFKNINSLEILSENFNRLLQREIDVSLNIANSLSVLDILNSHLYTNKHPSIKKINALQKVYQADKKRIAMDNKPNITIGLDYVFVDAYSDVNPYQNGKDILVAKIIMNLPVFNKKYNSQKEQLVIKQAILQEELVNQKNQLNIALNEATLLLDNAILTVVASEKNKIEIQRAINVDLKAYETGILDYDKIVRLQLQKIRFQLMEVQAIKQAFIAKSKLAYLTE